MHGLNLMSSRGLVVNYAKNGTCIEAGLCSALYIVTCCTVYWIRTCRTYIVMSHVVYCYVNCSEVMSFIATRLYCLK